MATFDALDQPHVPTILLHGETGTAKGLVARVVHESGPRAYGGFIEINCAAIPETMLEVELCIAMRLEPSPMPNAPSPASWRLPRLLDEIDVVQMKVTDTILSL